jgi:hypothetical protein
LTKRSKHDLAKDVFEATFGYMLPRVLNAELLSLAHQPLICTNHTLTLTVCHAPADEFVRLEIDLERTLENVSGSRKQLDGVFTVDKQYPGRDPCVTLAEYTIESNGGRKSRGGIIGRSNTGECDDPVFEQSGRFGSTRVELKKMPKLHVGAKCTCHWKGVEYRHLNDTWYFFARYLTQKVAVDVHENGRFRSLSVRFPGYNEQKVVQGGPYRTDVILPNQAIQVRWEA